jgi:hypothetical protein
MKEYRATLIKTLPAQFEFGKIVNHKNKSRFNSILLKQITDIEKRPACRIIQPVK